MTTWDHWVGTVDQVRGDALLGRRVRGTGVEVVATLWIVYSHVVAIVVLLLRLGSRILAIMTRP